MAFVNYYIQDHCYYQNEYSKQSGSNEKRENSDDMDSYNTRFGKRGNENAHVIIKDQGDMQSNPNSVNQIIYLPSIGFCTQHEDLLLLEEESLVKPGEKFKTHGDFVQYINENAKKWFYYYKCFDSRKPNTLQEIYLYTCVYLRNKEKYVKKGLRKRDNSHKTNCPCKIKLRHLPNEKELTVVFVCNHHDHPLSEEAFYKLQHGRRLPLYIKEEIMDLLTLHVDVTKIKNYVQIATGFNMSRAFFSAIQRTLKSRNAKRHMSDERVQDLIKRLSDNNIFDSVRKGSNVSKEDVAEIETLQSVANLQESVKCEIQHNPWITDRCVFSNGNLTGNDDVFNKKEVIISHSGQCNDEMADCIVQKFDNSEDRYMAYETIVSSHENSDEYEVNVFSEGIYDDSGHNRDEINNTNNNNIIVSAENLINFETETENAISEVVCDDTGLEGDQVNVNYTDNEVIVTADNTINCNSDLIENINNEVENLEYHTDITNNNHNRDDCEACDDEVAYEIEYCYETKDAEVQTCDDINKFNHLVSVLDVCIKNGILTTLVNNEVITQLKYDYVDKAVQTEEINNSDTKPEEINAEEDNYIELTADGSYIKHEYIHKYNIDKYMCTPSFPKYVGVLSFKTGVAALAMFTNVYNEQAMFKMTTTQSGREGNTRMLYITNPKEMPRIVGRKKEKQLEECGKEVLMLKDRVRALEAKNLELEAIVKQLRNTSE